MQLKIISPNNILFLGKVHCVEIPTPKGVIGILPDHYPLSTIVSPGKVKLIPYQQEERILDAAAFLFENEYTVLNVSEGMVYIDGKEVIMFVKSGINTTTKQEVNIAFEQAHLEITKLTNTLQTRKIKNLNTRKKQGF
jgi:F0F1-type ATP synthase epsilon subunit